uniref:Saposin B-type domain-containing protein n=1 Tax=Steinernema glaseri TaxID=37863 RepID=A0A1I7ZYY4_9BILA
MSAEGCLSTTMTCRHRPPPLPVFILLVALVQAARADGFLQSLSPHPNHYHQCYSCASQAYLSVWNQLMHHYFPPKNFTDRCWSPDPDVGTVLCRTACFTIVEEIYEHYSGQGVLRGCVDRLLLFGLDDDVRDAITSYENSCRTTDRHLLQMVALSPENHLVLMCTCSGRLCNDRDMEYVLSGARTTPISPLLLLAAIVLPLCVL